jgi:hypothetical protein
MAVVDATRWAALAIIHGARITRNSRIPSTRNLAFGFKIRRLDEVDHLLWLLIELVKDWFVETNAHQPEDAERLLTCLVEGRSELTGVPERQA